LSEGGKIIIASKNSFSDSRIIPFDAVRIAEEILHLPITNTAMLGAFAALFDKITLEDIFASVKVNMAPRLQEKNIEVIKAAYDEVRK
jgi:pyruvate ferredoxin oxidoreductase gamma subunit